MRAAAGGVQRFAARRFGSCGWFLAALTASLSLCPIPLRPGPVCHAAGTAPCKLWMPAKSPGWLLSSFSSNALAISMKCSARPRLSWANANSPAAMARAKFRFALGVSPAACQRGSLSPLRHIALKATGSRPSCVSHDDSRSVEISFARRSGATTVRFLEWPPPACRPPRVWNRIRAEHPQPLIGFPKFLLSQPRHDSIPFTRGVKLV